MVRKNSLPQVRRWLYIDKAIATGSFPTREKLAVQCEVDVRTIQRDIDALRYVHKAPIEYDASRRGYYYRDASYRLTKVNVNEEELFALLIAEKVLVQYRGTEIYKHLESVFEKVVPFFADTVEVPSEWLSDVFTVIPQPSVTITPEIWRDIFAGVRESRVLLFRYRSPKTGLWTERELEPYHVLCYSGAWYCIGFSRNEAEVKTFALSRMKDLSVTGKHFTMPEAFSIETYRNRTFGIFRGEQCTPVALRFSAQAVPYIEERQWHPDQNVSYNEDGSLILRFPTSHLIDVKRWVLSWGSAVRVLEPPELIEEVSREHKDSLKQYDQE
jgi:predicted DNA-binding transcriptional regulator YafY